jgi:hypothetical protein
MTDVSLEELAARIRAKGRIGKYDVQAMEREVLKEGLTSRAEAEVLIALDRAVGSVHFSWPAFFAATLAEFAVWGSGRAGYIDADKAQWLLPLLTGKAATSRAARALVAIAQEAECFDEAFFAGTTVVPERRSAPMGQELACAA